MTPDCYVWRSQIQEFNGELQGTTTPGWSCLVFDGDVDRPLTPRSTTNNYTLTDADTDMVCMGIYMRVYVHVR